MAAIVSSESIWLPCKHFTARRMPSPQGGICSANCRWMLPSLAGDHGGWLRWCAKQWHSKRMGIGWIRALKTVFHRKLPLKNPFHRSKNENASVFDSLSYLSLIVFVVSFHPHWFGDWPFEGIQLQLRFFSWHLLGWPAPNEGIEVMKKNIGKSTMNGDIHWRYS